LTDWHLMEVVQASQTYGYAYNSQIAKDRIRRTLERTIRLTRETMSGLEYPGIVLALGGDMISGGIHDELRETDEMPVFPSIREAVQLLIGVIDEMRREFGKVFIPTAIGNHGRSFHKRAPAKNYMENNADWLIYTLLADHYRDTPSVTIMIPDTGETLFSVYGTRFLLTHGDQIGAKGGDGVIGAIGPVMRGHAKVGRSFMSLGIDMDHMIMGHYHQTLSLPSVTVCGSLKGPDEYATKHLRCPAEDPSQMLMLVHPEHGITTRMPIFLGDEACPDRTREGRSNAWVAAFAA
jgi:hypothetical protein